MSTHTVPVEPRLTHRGVTVLVLVMMVLWGLSLRFLGAGHIVTAGVLGALALVPLAVLAYCSEPREVRS